VEDGLDLDGYEIGEPLGRGGFGVVFRARRRSDGLEVALKILRDEERASAASVARLEREAAVLQSLAHPSIVKVFELGRLVDQRPYLVMELLRGRDLGAHVAEHGRLTPTELVPVLRDICSALDAAHRGGVLHRDLKPTNVFLDERGADRRAVLLDFGLAKLFGGVDAGLTASRELVGSEAAMAPEQLRGQPVDLRTDVYGLAAVTFFALTGRMPFEEQGSLRIRELHLYARVPEASALAPVPRAIDAVITRAMAKRPADRFADARSFFEAARVALEAPSRREADLGVVGAVHVAWVLPAADADDEDLYAHAERTLDSARRRLEEGGARLVDDAGNMVVAVVSPPSAARDLATVVRTAIDARADRDARLRVFVSVTVGTASLKDGRLAGGDVSDYASWTGELENGVFDLTGRSPDPQPR
jgi:serine/threonine-protein kinase